jgi:hypothetical protein
MIYKILILVLLSSCTRAKDSKPIKNEVPDRLAMTCKKVHETKNTFYTSILRCVNVEAVCYLQLDGITCFKR